MATAPFSCFAIAAPGLEPLVAAELKSLGERPTIEAGGVAWEGDARSMMRANLWLRTASRVLVRVARFRATEFHELERLAKRVAWERFLPATRHAAFRVTARKSRLYHSDAIAERLLAAAHAHPPPAETADAGAPPPSLFIARVWRDEFTISADTSGALLHMRGYRQVVGKAPLRETLAAALLMASQLRGETPLLDPFCGSGTIPIEAALLARDVAPGLSRTFAFLRWRELDDAAWRALVDEARARASPRCPVVIQGSDRDAGAIAAARANAERAGVTADVELSVRAVSAIEPPSAPGLVATNPPYGKRVAGGAGADVRDLYAQFGNVLRRACRGWQVALYTPSARLAGETRLPLESAFHTSNGGIPVDALVGRVPD